MHYKYLLSMLRSCTHIFIYFLNYHTIKVSVNHYQNHIHWSLPVIHHIQMAIFNLKHGSKIAKVKSSLSVVLVLLSLTVLEDRTYCILQNLSLNLPGFENVLDVRKHLIKWCGGSLWHLTDQVFFSFMDYVWST